MSISVLSDDELFSRFDRSRSSWFTPTPAPPPRVSVLTPAPPPRVSILTKPEPSFLARMSDDELFGQVDVNKRNSICFTSAPIKRGISILAGISDEELFNQFDDDFDLESDLGFDYNFLDEPDPTNSRRGSVKSTNFNEAIRRRSVAAMKLVPVEEDVEDDIDYDFDISDDDVAEENSGAAAGNSDLNKGVIVEKDAAGNDGGSDSDLSLGLPTPKRVAAPVFDSDDD